MNATCPVCNQPVDPAIAPTSTYRFLGGSGVHSAHGRGGCCGSDHGSHKHRA